MTTEFLTNQVMDIAENLRNNYVTNLGGNTYSNLLSQSDALKIAVEIQKNYLYAKANVISPSNNYPTALEAIAIAAGYKKDGL
jgi:hypothetical protein